jgi:hypothetical protein
MRFFKHFCLEKRMNVAQSHNRPLQPPVTGGKNATSALAGTAAASSTID